MTNTTKAFRPRRKARYHIRNWREYDQALVKRGALTMWVDEDVARHWNYSGPTQRGAQLTYSDVAIETVLTLKEVFHLPNRAAEDLMRLLLDLLGLDLETPDHSTLSRRGQTLRVRLPRKARGPLHAVLDSTGLKVYGEGEWKVRQHGWSKRRTWRKLHLAVDAEASEIEAVIVTVAGVPDAEAAPALLTQLERPLASTSADHYLIQVRSTDARSRSAPINPIHAPKPLSTISELPAAGVGVRRCRPCCLLVGDSMRSEPLTHPDFRSSRCLEP